MNLISKAALQYIESGMAIFPIRGRTKIPLTTRGFKDASKHPHQIRTWWEQWPNANIGIATGPGSGFWVLDIDGSEGERSLHTLEEKHGLLPSTREVITGSGGRHLYFQWTNFLNFSISAGKLGKGLDIRGNGGYVVAPPSVHPNGRVYEWSVDSSDVIASAPDWVIGLIQSPQKTDNNQKKVDLLSILQGVKEGRRNDCLARLAGKLLGHHLEPKFCLYLLAAWNEARCSPPLEWKEFYRTFVSITQAEAKKRGGL